MQYSGENAELLVKVDRVQGVTDIGGKEHPTVLAKPTVLGASELKVDSAANYSVGDYVLVGNETRTPEIVRVSALVMIDDAQGDQTIRLENAFYLQSPHAAGESVAVVVPTAGAAWVSMGNATSITVPETTSLAESNAFTPGGVRAVSNVRQGRRSFSSDINAELNLRSSLFFLRQAIGQDYVSDGETVTGGDAADTTLHSAVASGALQLAVQLVDFDDIDVGDFLRIEAANSDKKEVIKVTSKSSMQVLNFASPLRFSHLANTVIVKVQGPFGHEIKRGTNLPTGYSTISKLTKMNGDESLMLLSGNKINSLSLTASGAEPFTSMSINAIAKNGSIFADDIFTEDSDPSLEHIPYMQWEGMVKINGNIQGVNFLTSLTVNIENNVVASQRFGSFAPGTVQSGLGRISGSFNYEFHNQNFLKFMTLGQARELEFTWSYSQDSDNQLVIMFPRVLFGGAAHPSISERSPIEDTKNFTAVLDPVTETDIKVTARTSAYSLDDIGG